MKLQKLVYMIAAGAVLQGCATPGPDFSQLPIYSDNRVGYTLTRNGSSSATRVWTNGETILALQFGKRLINAKDIESVTVQQTRKPYVPVHIEVRLKSKESLVADVFEWGNSYRSDILVEWLACTKNRMCEYANRKPSIKGLVSFDKTPNFLTSINEARFEDIGSRKAEDFFSWATDEALPGDNGRMQFADAQKISDLSEGVKAAQVDKERVKKCVADAYSAEERSRKQIEQRIIRETPPAQVQQALATWRASLRTGFAQTMTLEMHCK